MTKKIDEVFFSKSHEWVRIEDDLIIACGISEHAKDELGDVVFIGIEDIALNKTVKKGDEVCVVESTKAVSDIYSPAAGVIVAANDLLKDSPELLNEETNNWIFKIKLNSLDELDDLLTFAQYQEFLNSQDD